MTEEATNEEYPTAKAVTEYVENSEKETAALLKKKSIPYTTATGCTISISDHLEGESVIDCKIYGNSVQNGTPSPDNPVEIQSVGDLVTDEASEYYGKYDVPVIVHGKNLINESAITLSSGYWSDVDGHPINNNSRFIMISSVKCNPNTKYALSSNLKIYTIWFFNNDTSISRIYAEKTPTLFVTPENCNRLRISLVNTSGNTDTVAFK